MQEHLISVKNAEGDSDTTARVIVHNEIDYTPKISVIIPVYNTEEYLRECLDSVVNQTLKEIEIICVDDGSTDSSLDILIEYAQKDKRFTILAQQNLHAGVARNAGIAVANGEYLSFLDSDDFFELFFLDSVYSIIKQEKSDFVVYQYTNFDNDTQKKMDIKGINKKFSHEINTINVDSIADEAFTICNPMPWNKLISHDLVNKEELRFQSLTASNDIYFSLCLMAAASKVTFFSKSFVNYRYNRCTSLRNSRDKYPFNFYHAYKGVDDFLKKKQKVQFYKTFIKSFISSALWTIDNTDIQKKNVTNFIATTIIPEYDILGKNKNFLSKAQISRLENLHCKEIIISLTSYPGRINTVHLVIESLLKQTVKADRIILWLAQEQFPHKETDLPVQLLILCQKGLTIDWYHDIRSYKKLIPTLRKYPDALIVTADDDLIYPEDWLYRLVSAYDKQPNMLHCLRAHYVKIESKSVRPYNEWPKELSNSTPCFSNFFTGVGGVLFKKDLLHSDIMNEDLFQRICPDGDDIWFWGMAVLKGTKINLVSPTLKKLQYTPGSQDDDLPLWKKNVLQNENDKKIQAFLLHYPDVLKRIINEAHCSKLWSPVMFNNHTNKKIILLGFPLYHKQIENNKKHLFLLGIQIYKVIKNEHKHRVSILGIPIYSRKKEGYTVTRRLLFFRYKKHYRIQELQDKLWQNSKLLQNIRGELTSLRNEVKVATTRPRRFVITEIDK